RRDRDPGRGDEPSSRVPQFLQHPDLLVLHARCGHEDHRSRHRDRQAHQRARAPLPVDGVTSEGREFDGKVAIVTGGGAGIGYAIARAFAREGGHVAIVGRTKETLTRSAEAIERECGAPVLAVAADVAEPADCEGMIAETVRRFGAIDMLVNNAALFSVVPLIDADAAEASRFFAVNAIGPLNAARAFARWAIDHRRGGAIVNISSIAAGRPALNVGLYSASTW